MDASERKRKWYAGLLVLPIGAFVAALGCDVAYTVTQHLVWFVRAGWLIAIGLAGGCLAAIAGFAYFAHDVPRTSSTSSKLATAHMALSVAVLALFAINLGLRVYAGGTAWARWLAVYLTVVGNIELAISTAMALRLQAQRRKHHPADVRITMGSERPRIPK